MPIRHRSLAVAACALLLAAGALAAQSAPPAAPATPSPAIDDPFIWLEDVEGERALAWVRERNARSLGLLQSDPRYDSLHTAALAIVNATDRIASPAFFGDELSNFWQDREHVRGPGPGPLERQPKGPPAP